MREYLFRGWSDSINNFVYGNLYQLETGIFVIRTKEDIFFVDEKTISQYIEREDKKGNKIFEYDIIHAEDGNRYSVTWCKDSLSYKFINHIGMISDLQDGEIIGDIQFSPQFLLEDITLS